MDYEDDFDEVDEEESEDEESSVSFAEKGYKEKAEFDAMEAVFGRNLSIFYMCVRYDVPFETSAVPRTNTSSAWADYKNKLRRKGAYHKPNFGGKGFLDGMVDLTKIFGADLTLREFSKAVDAEVAARITRAGTNKQRAAWGSGGAKTPYTKEDYDELDRLYAAFSSRQKGMGIDTQQEYILRDCARMELQKQKYIQAKDIGSAQKLNAMIQTNLASENLRKKDEKPMDDLRIDGIADALEKKYGIDPERMLAKEKAVEICCKWFMEHGYPETLDCAHKMTLAIINATRINNEEPPLMDLPEELSFTDDFGEFAEKPNEAEQQAYEYLGLIREQKPEAPAPVKKKPTSKKDGKVNG